MHSMSNGNCAVKREIYNSQVAVSLIKQLKEIVIQMEYNKLIRRNKIRIDISECALKSKSDNDKLNFKLWKHHKLKPFLMFSNQK